MCISEFRADSDMESLRNSIIRTYKNREPSYKLRLFIYLFTFILRLLNRHQYWTGL
jgi:hypothetical protein